MPTIHFDKISMHNRTAEPISLGIPFAQGQLTDPAQFGIRNNGTDITVQTDITARWDDGSVKWLLTHFQADLPGNQSHDLTFAIDGSISNPTPSQTVTVTEKSEGIEIDIGVLHIVCARENFDLFRQVRLNGTEIFGPGTFTPFTLSDTNGNSFQTAHIDNIEILESGPVRALVELAGKHTGKAGNLFDFRILIEAWAGKPHIRLDYQFINRESAKSIDLSEITLKLTSSATGDVRCATGEGHYRTSVKEGPNALLLNAETIVYQAVEHVLETFYGDFWADWSDTQKGVCITPFQAHQNFPKGIAVHENGIDLDIYPSNQNPIKILQGVAKTHRMQFYFHAPDMSLDDIVVQSLQFQYPDIGILPESWFRDANVWENLFPTNKNQSIESSIINMADGRNHGLGMMHWGDGPDHGYTQQGRGKGELVWTNNEYDFPHAMFLLYAKTGERRFRDVACVAAQHWIDVDFCHHSDDPLKMGGQPIHTAGHVTGGVTPSHEWTEGLLDYYHFTGKREAYKKAVSIADNMLRHLALPKFSQSAGFAARETGWAMRGLMAVHNETKDEKYLNTCRVIAEQFLEWKNKWGAFLAPYTSHTLIRVPFMISIAVNALHRYYAATQDDRIPSLIVEEMGDLLDHCLMPDGRFFYKELPSLNRRAGGPREMEALCHAYEHSGDKRFLKQAAFMMKSTRPSGSRSGKRIVKDLVGDTVLFDGSGPKSFASFYVPFMSAYKTLSDENMIS
jgi:hypothetical protein